MVNKDFVFSRIGMALISTQRVEFIASQLVAHLSEFDMDIYGITGEEFLAATQKANLARATLGKIFTLLKLNSTLVIENELDEYLTKRNMLVHGFWRNYLDSISIEQAKRAVDFCYDFGRHSERLESFFKGFIHYLVFHPAINRLASEDEKTKWTTDYEYFQSALQYRRLIDKS